MKYILFCLFTFFGLNAQAQLFNLANRNSTTLNGKWNYIIDPYETGYYNYRREAYDLAATPSNSAFFMDYHSSDSSELVEYNFDRSEEMLIPSDWNSQAEKLLYYEGTVWFRKKFTWVPVTGKRVFVYFAGANYQTEVYLNGKKIGIHKGGFTPFYFEVTDIIRTKNSIVVKVDNKRELEAVPTINTDWWNYGGITRDVSIVETPGTFISDYRLALSKDGKVVDASISLNGKLESNQKVSIQIPGLKIKLDLTTDAKGIATIKIPVAQVKKWSDENPHLYKVNISTALDAVTDQIGFRTIETRDKSILLNGKKIFLRGISMHEENPLKGGRVSTEAECRQLLTWAKELGCNYVRLAHYPHSERMAKLADEMGILVWEEIPVYWTIQWSNPQTYQLASWQLTELINRDFNRASVIIWSVANETPEGTSRNLFLNGLISTARSMDSTRLISAALEKHTKPNYPNIQVVEDPIASVVDVVAFNQYIGWYDGLPDKCLSVTWEIPYNKPVVISEFGADALHGLHGSRLARWTEEYQEDLYRSTIEMMKNISGFAGVSPWILCDFRSPRRPLSGIQDGWNRKGLISQNGTKKKAWYTLNDFYKSLIRK